MGVINDGKYLENFENFRNQKTLVLMFAYPSIKHFRKNVNKGYKNGDGGAGRSWRAVTPIGQN